MIRSFLTHGINGECLVMGGWFDQLVPEHLSQPVIIAIETYGCVYLTTLSPQSIYTDTVPGGDS